jgi:glutamate--cysteine ligase
VLQIENEYYSNIRPKRVTYSGERPIQALVARGVQYVEVRCLDINPFLPNGIDLQQARFIDAFVLYCALQESPQLAENECSNAASNFLTVVKEGRRPGLELNRKDGTIDLKVWATELLEKITPIARLLDEAQGTDEHVKSIAAQQAKVNDPSLTPSARVLASMNEHKEGFTAFSMRQSQLHAEYFRGTPLSVEEQSNFETLARTSIAEQAELEQTEEVVDFDTFVGAYQASILRISN